MAWVAGMAAKVRTICGATRRLGTDGVPPIVSRGNGADILSRCGFYCKRPHTRVGTCQFVGTRHIEMPEPTQMSSEDGQSRGGFRVGSCHHIVWEKNLFCGGWQTERRLRAAARRN